MSLGPSHCDTLLPVRMRASTVVLLTLKVVLDQPSGAFWHHGSSYNVAEKMIMLKERERVRAGGAATSKPSRRSLVKTEPSAPRAWVRG